MIECNPIRAVCNYGSSAPYKDPPTEEQIRNGVVPLDSLPAAWWNWMWNETNSAMNEARTAMSSVITEIQNVLCAAGIEPQDACMDQLSKAVSCLGRVIATANTPGSVKSSSVCGKVSVDTDGIMTANGLGNVSNLSTTARTNVVAAINELKSVYDGCFTETAGSITALENGKLGCSAKACCSATADTAEYATCAGTADCATNATCASKDGAGCAFGTAARCAATSFRASTWTPACVACAGQVMISNVATTLGSAAACASSCFASAGIASCPGLACTGTSTVPTNHASTATTYGAGTGTNYGHVKVCDCYTASGGCASGSVAASSCAVFDAYTQARCLGNAINYNKTSCSDSGQAADACCVLTLGLARSYSYRCLTTDVRSYDRRTYTQIGTYQEGNSCSGMTFIDTCVWQCCYSGTAGVTTCTNRRWCFCSDGSFHSPGNVCGSNICAAAGRDVFTRNTVGDTGWTTEADRVKVPDMAFMAYWDGSHTSTGASNLRYYCGGAFGSAAACAATDFRASTWTPTCVECSGYANAAGLVYASSHPGSWYLRQDWDGTYFQTQEANGESRLPIKVGAAGSADYAGSAHYLRTFDVNGCSHGDSWQMYWKWNGSYFYPSFNSGDNNTCVTRSDTSRCADSATNAGYATSAGSATSATSARSACASCTANFACRSLYSCRIILCGIGSSGIICGLSSLGEVVGMNHSMCFAICSASDIDDMHAVYLCATDPAAMNNGEPDGSRWEYRFICNISVDPRDSCYRYLEQATPWIPGDAYLTRRGDGLINGVGGTDSAFMRVCGSGMGGTNNNNCVLNCRSLHHPLGIFYRGAASMNPVVEIRAR